MTLPVDDRWWSIGRVARELGCSIPTVKKLESAGKLLPHHRLEGRGDRRYDPGTVMAYVARLASPDSDSAPAPNP